MTMERERERGCYNVKAITDWTWRKKGSEKKGKLQCNSDGISVSVWTWKKTQKMKIQCAIKD